MTAPVAATWYCAITLGRFILRHINMMYRENVLRIDQRFPPLFTHPRARRPVQSFPRLYLYRIPAISYKTTHNAAPTNQ